MKTISIQNVLIHVLTILLVSMWTYSGLSKLQEFGQFGIELNRSPYLQPFSGPVSYLLPLTEFTLAFLLVYSRTRRWGLYISLLLMVFFTAYIYAMLHYSYYISCACMGLFEDLSWEAHLGFNVIVCLICGIAILLHQQAADTSATKSYAS